MISFVNGEQKRLLCDYEESKLLLIEAERKEAFIQGVKFATHFLFKQQRNNE